MSIEYLIVRYINMLTVVVAGVILLQNVFLLLSLVIYLN